MHVFTLGTSALSGAVVVVVSSIFLLMDITLKPESLRKYKVQLNENEPADSRKIMKVIDVVRPRRLLIRFRKNKSTVERGCFEHEAVRA